MEEKLPSENEKSDLIPILSSALQHCIMSSFPPGIADIVYGYLRGPFVHGDYSEELSLNGVPQTINLCDIFIVDKTLYVFNAFSLILHLFCCPEKRFIDTIKIDAPNKFHGPAVKYCINTREKEILIVNPYCKNTIHAYSILTGKYVNQHDIILPEEATRDPYMCQPKMSQDSKELYISYNNFDIIHVYDTATRKRKKCLQLKNEIVETMETFNLRYCILRTEYFQEYENKIYAIDIDTCIVHVFEEYEHKHSWPIRDHANNRIYVNSFKIYRNYVYIHVHNNDIIHVYNMEFKYLYTWNHLLIPNIVLNISESNISASDIVTSDVIPFNIAPNILSNLINYTIVGNRNNIAFYKDIAFVLVRASNHAHVRNINSNETPRTKIIMCT